MDYVIYPPISSSAALGGMSNLEVFCITFTVALGVSFLIYMLPRSTPSSLLAPFPTSIYPKMYAAGNQQSNSNGLAIQGLGSGGGISFLPRFSANGNVLGPEMLYGFEPPWRR
jgi:hypothetical protein